MGSNHSPDKPKVRQNFRMDVRPTGQNLTGCCPCPFFGSLLRKPNSWMLPKFSQVQRRDKGARDAKNCDSNTFKKEACSFSALVPPECPLQSKSSWRQAKQSLDKVRALLLANATVGRQTTDRHADETSKVSTKTCWALPAQAAICGSSSDPTSTARSIHYTCVSRTRLNLPVMFIPRLSARSEILSSVSASRSAFSKVSHPPVPAKQSRHQSTTDSPLPSTKELFSRPLSTTESVIVQLLKTLLMTHLTNAQKHR